MNGRSDALHGVYASGRGAEHASLEACEVHVDFLRDVEPADADPDFPVKSYRCEGRETEGGNPKVEPDGLDTRGQPGVPKAQ